MEQKNNSDIQSIDSVSPHTIAKPYVSRRSDCIFRMYGEEEKICSKCGYVIPVTKDDLKALDDTIKSTTELPKCRHNVG